MAHLNAQYVAAGASYDPPVFEFPDIELPEQEDTDKSLDGDRMDSSGKVKVMPNPFDDLVTFDFDELVNDESDMQLVFYDVVGKRIHSQIIPAGQRIIQIQGTNLPDGMIYYTLISNGTRLESGTIVKIK